MGDLQGIFVEDQVDRQEVPSIITCGSIIRGFSGEYGEFAES